MAGTGMNLGVIVAEAKAKENAEIERFAEQLMEMLNEHVPATQKETFMLKFSAAMHSMGDVHPTRIAVFNKVHSLLHAENRRR